MCALIDAKYLGHGACQSSPPSPTNLAVQRVRILQYYTTISNLNETQRREGFVRGILPNILEIPGIDQLAAEGANSHISGGSADIGGVSIRSQEDRAKGPNFVSCCCKGAQHFCTFS